MLLHSETTRSAPLPTGSTGIVTRPIVVPDMVNGCAMSSVNGWNASKYPEPFGVRIELP